MIRRGRMIAAAGLLAITAAASTLGASAGAATAARHAPARASLGDHAICRPQRVGQACLTRNDVGVTGTRNRLYERNGIREFGGYWTVEAKNHVNGKWPFRYEWANSKWKGWQVVHISTYTYEHQYAAEAGGTCVVHITTCLARKDGSNLWVEYRTGTGRRTYWHFISVQSTDEVYQHTGMRRSYAMTFNGVGRVAITSVYTGRRGQSFTMPGV